MDIIVPVIVLYIAKQFKMSKFPTPFIKRSYRDYNIDMIAISKENPSMLMILKAGKLKNHDKFVSCEHYNLKW